MKLLPLALAAVMSAAAFGSARPALAQNGDDGGNGYDTQSQTMGAASDDDDNDMAGNPHERDGWRGDRAGRDRDGNRDWHRRMMMGGGPGWMHPHRPPPGASFRFQHGRDRVDIHCPPRQSLEVCVDAAGQLMRELAAMKHAGAATPSHSEMNGDTDGHGATGSNDAGSAGSGATKNLDTDGVRRGGTTAPSTSGTPDAAPAPEEGGSRL